MASARCQLGFANTSRKRIFRSPAYFVLALALGLELALALVAPSVALVAALVVQFAPGLALALAR